LTYLLVQVQALIRGTWWERRLAYLFLEGVLVDKYIVKGDDLNRYVDWLCFWMTEYRDQPPEPPIY